jgi:hypothetical protein
MKTSRASFLVVSAMVWMTGCASAADEPAISKKSEDRLILVGSAGDDEPQGISAAREATRKYEDVNVAIADGYVPITQCESSPAGGMGMHFLNAARALAEPDPAAPALLLYEPNGVGLTLVGVEYYAAVTFAGVPWEGPIAPPPPPATNAAPKLFGHTFDGPMAGHGPGQPWHYDLHVWIFRKNPNGLFAQWNPNVTCEGATP